MKRPKTCMSAFSVLAFLASATNLLALAPLNPPPQCNGDPECAKCVNKERIAAGCIFVSLDLGRTLPSSIAETIFLRIHTAKECPSLATPQQLKVVCGYTFKNVDGISSSGGAFETVRFVQPDGVEEVFHFKAGESVGIPEPNIQGKPISRVLMVDAEGWATADSPAYYDLYPGDGSVWRFSASELSTERGNLISYTDPHGRTLTPEDMGIDIIRDAAGFVRQVKTPSRLADVVTHDATHYTVTVYPFASEPSLIEGLYEIPSHPPTRVLDVSRGNSDGELFIRFKKGTGDFRLFRYVSANGDWTLFRPDGITDLQEIYFNDDESTCRRVHFFRNSNGLALSRTEINYAFAHWGYLPTNRIEGILGDGVRTTTWDYYPSGVHKDLVKRITKPSGLQIEFEYDDKNRPIREWRPLTDEATEYSYVSVSPDDLVFISDSRPRTIVKTRNGIEIERTYYVFGTNGIDVVERVGEQGAAYGGTNVLRTIVTHNPVVGAVSDGLIRTIRNEDGSLDCYEYVLENGNWIETVTHVHEQAPDPRPFHTTRDISVSDRRGNVVRTATELLVENGQWEAIESVNNEYDLEGNLVRTTDLAGRTTTSEWSGFCCGKTSETSWNGITTVFAYDDNGNTILESIQQPTLVDIVHDFDELSREVLSYMTNRTDGIGSFPMEIAYDSLGRIVGKTNEHGEWESHSFSNDGCIETIQAPAMTPRIVETLPDGRLSRVRGTPEETRCYVYGVDSDGSTWTKTIRGPNPESSVFRTEFYDMLGRLFKREEFGTGGGTIATIWKFDEYGRTAEQKRIEDDGTNIISTSILAAYDPIEGQSLTAMDVNGNGQIDLSGPDRVSCERLSYVRKGVALWREDHISVFADDDTSDETVVSVDCRQLTGFDGICEQSVHIDSDGNGTTVTKRYDPDKNLVIEETTVPAYAATDLRCFHFGMNVSNTYSRGFSECISYDGLGRERQRTTIENGDVVRTTFYERDSLGRIAATATSTGEEEVRHYDRGGRILSVERNNGYAVTNQYNPDGKVISVGGTCRPKQYSYDEYGRVSTMSVGGDSNATNQLVVEYRYDPNTDKLTAKKMSCGGWITFSYGLDGRLRSKTSARGISKVSTYSPFGDLLSTSYSDGTPSIQYEYDRMGRVVAITDGTGTREFSYDGVSRHVVSETVPLGRTIQRTFDEFGRNVGVALDEDYDVEMAFDSNGRVSTIESVCGVTTNIFHYAYAGLQSVPIQVSHGSFLRSLTYKPDSVEIVETMDRFGNDILAGWHYEYEPWNRTNREHGDDGTEVDFSYDELNELSGIAGDNGVFSYEYDLLGNLRSVSNETEVVHFGVDTLGRASDANGTVIEYDADGNIVAVGPIGYSWDAEGRLVSATSNGIEIVRFEYDHMGRCVRRIASERETEFIYDGWRLLEQCDGTNKTMFVWGVDRFGELKSTHPVGALLSVVESERTSFPIYDGKGNIRQYADVNGTVVSSYDYDGFGRTVAQSGEQADTFLHRYSTHLYDSILGCYYYGHRFYNPALGRWMSPDPIQETGGDNLYAFCENNPIDNWDYLGLVTADALQKHKHCIRQRNAWRDRIRDSSTGLGQYWQELKGNRECELPTINCKCCEEDMFDAGGYFKHGVPEINVCENNLSGPVGWTAFGRTAAHELTHYAQWFCFKWTRSSCDTSICKEIQAYARQHKASKTIRALGKDEILGGVQYSSRCACASDLLGQRWNSSISCSQNIENNHFGEILKQKIEERFQLLYGKCNAGVGNPGVL